jgi:hypothetical protein
MKNHNPIGDQVKSCVRLCRLADEKKAVVVTSMMNARIPAAIVQNWQTRFVVNLISRKKIFEYVPDPSKKRDTRIRNTKNKYQNDFYKNNTFSNQKKKTTYLLASDAGKKGKITDVEFEK